MGGVIEIQMRYDDELKEDGQLIVFEFHERMGVFVDDITVKKLCAKLAKVARKKEVSTMEEMVVWAKVPRAQVKARGNHIVAVRWVDHDKARRGGKLDVRSRLVVNQFATSDQDDIFAATPALEAVKLLLSLNASSRNGYSPTRKVLVLDVKRAFLYADAKGELPEEAKSEEDGDVVGVLRKAMYGTREAPLCWQLHLTKFLRSLDFKPGVSSPCLFYHEGRDIRLTMHVDDLMLTGEEEDLVWFRTELEKSFQCKSQMLGPDLSDVRLIG